MKREILYRALLSRFDSPEAETIVEQVASLEDQNIERLKDVFATKEDLFATKEDLYKALHEVQHSLYTDLSNKIDNKIDKIYWFILGQTAIMVGIMLAILRTANVF